MPRVMIIEDETPLRKSLVTILTAEGFEAVGVPDGLAAVTLLEKELPDIIVSDISMPEMDGYEVLRTLRNDPATVDIPLIFITARAQRRDVRYGMELGAADYLTKPFSPAELVNTIRTQLARKKEQAEKFSTQIDELRHNIIYSLPHELRTPLVGIQGFATLLTVKADNATPEDVLRAANTILTSSQRLSHLIENYLVYAQLELIKHDPVKMQELRRKTTENAAYPIHETAIAIANDFQRDDDLQLSLEDATLQIGIDDLTKTISAIVNNAFKFSKANTQVGVQGYVYGDSYRIAVQDYGCGMTHQQISQIGAYMQFDRKLHEQQGLGLGLIIAQRLIELYGGKFHIESIYTQETTVTIELPLHTTDLSS